MQWWGWRPQGWEGGLQECRWACGAGLLAKRGLRCPLAVPCQRWHEHRQEVNPRVNGPRGRLSPTAYLWKSLVFRLQEDGNLALVYAKGAYLWLLPVRHFVQQTAIWIMRHWDEENFRVHTTFKVHVMLLNTKNVTWRNVSVLSCCKSKTIVHFTWDTENIFLFLLRLKYIFSHLPEHSAKGWWTVMDF